MPLEHPVFPVATLPNWGDLILMPCPGCHNVDVEMVLQQLAKHRTGALLTLMPQAEMSRNQLGLLPLLCQSANIAWLHLPIVDDEVPDAAFELAWAEKLPQVLPVLQRGQGIAIHCKGGTGRTGLVAARLLLTLGLPLQEVISRVRAARPKALQIPKQMAHIEHFSTSLGCSNLNGESL